MESIGKLLRSFRWISSDTKAGGIEIPTYAKWRRFFVFGCLPVITLCALNVFFNHKPERPEFIAYEHMRLRTKRFPWGDGERSLFHNKKMNALPTGYEED
ncbi:cytochrome c oxidase subunit 6A1, mitochondrial-like [Phlebotomus argentipes]|uniref:cytochrome c oxidase subunit 6A1, mitochondrial-like n=1 Tax=Phlebotomus argentipes TaxID=94469 RepID=UPI002892C664|nr:cytochrome c oxidase subunit 6A1, mitochondrial-like [Phlebotomus argentipes]